MTTPAHQNLILIEGAATYERILAEVREVETDEGIRHIQDFLKIFPDFAPAHNDVAVLYHQTGNPLKALAHYEKAHKLDPANITFRKNLADFYFVELEWSREAINTYLDILKDNPFDLEALNALGTISQQIGRKEQAKQYFSRTLRLDNSNSEARQALQELDVTLLDVPDSPQPAPARAAAVEQKTTVTTPPPTPPVFPSLASRSPQPVRTPEELHREALVSVNAGNTDEAVKQLANLLERYADYAPAHNDLGILYQQRGDMLRSRRHHEEAVRLQPANVLFKKNLADLLFVGFGDHQAALAIYVALLGKNPHDVEILKALSQLCLEIDQLDDAAHFLKQVLTITPWDNEAREALSALKQAGTGPAYR